MARNLFALSLSIVILAPNLVIAQTTNVPVLIPVFYAGPGAFGSQWNTQLTILNNSDTALTSVPYIYQCPIPEGCMSPIPAHASIAFLAGAPNCPGCFQLSTGYFQNVRSDELLRAIFTLRIFDESQSALDYGTQIPVVPATSFRETELNFLDVPADNHFRTTLRIYALPNSLPTARVRSYREPAPGFSAPQAASILISDQTVRLDPPPPSGFLRGPSVIVNDPVPAMTSTDGSRYRVTVQSSTPGQPVWALLTVTNNQTHRVSAVLPQ
jgi:hypothetical protein